MDWWTLSSLRQLTDHRHREIECRYGMCGTSFRFFKCVRKVKVRRVSAVRCVNDALQRAILILTGEVWYKEIMAKSFSCMINVGDINIKVQQELIRILCFVSQHYPRLQSSSCLVWTLNNCLSPQSDLTAEMLRFLSRWSLNARACVRMKMWRFEVDVVDAAV